jgi:hypothetical protein
MRRAPINSRQVLLLLRSLSPSSFAFGEGLPATVTLVFFAANKHKQYPWFPAFLLANGSAAALGAMNTYAILLH